MIGTPIRASLSGENVLNVQETPWRALRSERGCIAATWMWSYDRGDDQACGILDLQRHVPQGMVCRSWRQFRFEQGVVPGRLRPLLRPFVCRLAVLGALRGQLSGSPRRAPGPGGESSFRCRRPRSRTRRAVRRALLSRRVLFAQLCSHDALCSHVALCSRVALCPRVAFSLRARADRLVRNPSAEIGVSHCC